ncbi:site-specific integrase [Oscillospiraceae bacterium OttesenSCG-928-F05]|nr:site-specific integrase [Oscillospiraceae bacterium OttesenSCG-928-F05]
MNNNSKNKARNGDGAWTKTKTGWAWQKMIGRKPDGTPDRRSVSGKTQTECRRKMDELIKKTRQRRDATEREAHVQREQAAEARRRGRSPESETLFRDAFVRWLELYKAPPTKKATTYSSYLDINACHFDPFFGDMPLYRITQDAVQEYYTTKQKDGARKDGKRGGLSPKTLRNHHMLLKDFFEYARAQYKLECNPTIKTERPKVINPKMRVLDSDEMLIFLKEIIRETQRVAILTCLFTGLRVGELLPLEVADLDFKAQTIQINKDLVRVKTKALSLDDPNVQILNYKPENKTHLIIQHTPKTETSIAQQPISDDLFGLIVRHLYFLDQSGWPNPEGLLFPSKVGTYLDPKCFEKRLTAISQRCEIKRVNPHALRHTFATRLVEQNVPLTTVMNLMRHSSIQMTQRYVSTMTAEKREAMENLSVYLHPEKLNVNRLNGQSSRMKFADVKVPVF